MIGTFRERRRHAGVAGLAIGLLATVIPLLNAAPASADTSTTHTVLASTNASAPSIARPGPLTGLVNGQVVTLRVTEAGPSDQITSLQAIRQCQGGAPITNSGDLGPANTGYCLSSPLNASSDNVKTNISKASGSDNFIQTTFRVGIGSQDVTYDPGTGTNQINHIDCDSTHDCSLWIQIGRSGGSDLVHYNLEFLGNPGAPGVTAACTGSGATVTLTPPANTGHSTIASYTVSAASSDGGAAVASQTVPGPTATFTGFTAFKHYDITATATNAGGLTGPASVSAGSTLGVQTCPAGPTAVNANAAPHQVTLSWSYADSANATGYDVSIRDNSNGNTVQTVSVSGGGTLSTVVGSLTTGHDYFAKVRATYAGGNLSAFSTEVEFSPPPDTILTQTITVTRPQGTLVLTQVCGTAGTAPHTPGPGPLNTPGAGAADPLYGQYPYPVDANGVGTATYPTDCGINLGTAHLITGAGLPGSGQFFEASGALNQVTVVDARDTDPGWVVNGQMGDFKTGVPGEVIKGDMLGWTPTAVDTPGFTYAGGSYDQGATAGPAVAPNQPIGTGLGRTPATTGNGVLASAPAHAGLGIAKLDAALKLLIPINAMHGLYTGTLTITAI